MTQDGLIKLIQRLIEIAEEKMKEYPVAQDHRTAGYRDNVAKAMRQMGKRDALQYILSQLSKGCCEIDDNCIFCKETIESGDSVRISFGQVKDGSFEDDATGPVYYAHYECYEQYADDIPWG